MQLDFVFLVNENKGHWRTENREKPFCKNINTGEFKVSELLGLYNAVNVGIQVEKTSKRTGSGQVVEFLFDFLSNLRIQDRQPVNKSPLVSGESSLLVAQQTLSYLLSVFVQFVIITSLNVTFQMGHRFPIIIKIIKFSTEVTSQALLRDSLHCRWFPISPGLTLEGFREHKYFMFQMKPTRCTLLLTIFISTSVHVSGNCVPIIKRTYCIFATLVFFTVYEWLSGLQTRQPRKIPVLHR